MPAKYHIHTESAPPRFRPVGKLGIVDWREDCANCRNCVKDACVYGFYRDEADTLRDKQGYLDYIYQCKGCLNCVQNCTKNILTRVVNPEYENLGDEYYTPEIILSTWFQSEAGHIPVSGSGYGGPFSGSGFDSMWTDMSEIVRPTRDGIHGREYINTSVDIGRKLSHLAFSEGDLAVTPPPLIDVPLPAVFDLIPSNFSRGVVREAIVKAAERIGTMSVVDAANLPGAVKSNDKGIIPLLIGAAAGYEEQPFVMVNDSDNVFDLIASLKKANPNQIVAIRLQASPESTQRIVDLAGQGAEVIHLVFDIHGMESTRSNPRHMRDVLRDVHGTLTKAAVRDEITLIASGGIALPEHMTKAIICGADLVAIDLPLVVALECRLCGECERGQSCQISLEDVELDYAVQRIVNLMGAWHSQLLEMLGAMGIREARRLRGETGRCMFFEDLEEDTFGRLFGERKSEVGAQ